MVHHETALLKVTVDNGDDEGMTSTDCLDWFDEDVYALVETVVDCAEERLLAVFFANKLVLD